MHFVGHITEGGINIKGESFVWFSVEETGRSIHEMVQELKDKRLVIDAKPYRKKRSLDANAYFWQLCDKIAKRLNSDKDTIYLLQLSRYGVFTDVEILKEAYPTLKEKIRYTEILSENGDYQKVRCYFGSSTYDTKEMSDLINGTVNDALEMGGIEVMTPDELSAMLSAWRGGA